MKFWIFLSTCTSCQYDCIEIAILKCIESEIRILSFENLKKHTVKMKLKHHYNFGSSRLIFKKISSRNLLIKLKTNYSFFYTEYA